VKLNLGSGHSILDRAIVKDEGIRSVVLANPNYRQEALDFFRSIRYNVEVIDIGAHE